MNFSDNDLRGDNAKEHAFVMAGREGRKETEGREAEEERDSEGDGNEVLGGRRGKEKE